MNHNLPLGIRYWYMPEAIQFGWSRNILDMQIKSGLFQRRIKDKKINNFSKLLPDPQSDLANYLLKDPYIFDLVGAKEQADERNIEEQLVAPNTCWKWGAASHLWQDRSTSRLEIVISTPT